MPLDKYAINSDKLYYKHTLSKNLPCDAYSMHTHNTYELIYFINGDATHIIEDKKYKLKRGDLIFVRPFKYHFIQIDSPTDYDRCHFLFDAERHRVEGTELIPDDLEVVNLRGNTIAEELLRKIDLYREKCDEDTFQKLVPHLLSELFYNILAYDRSVSEEGALVSETISEALKYINENLYTISNISEIANHLFVSESYFFRLFKAELHQTPKKYIMNKRLLMAQKMIESGERPTSVCAKCGFGDYTAFYRSYVTMFGHSPSST